MNKSEIDFAMSLLTKAKINLSTKIPTEITGYLNSAKTLLQRVEKLIGTEAHGDYFEASSARYIHYLAAAMRMPEKSKVLEIGGAPGHVSIGLYLLGMELTSINLNEFWRNTYPSPEWIKKLGVIEHDIEKAPLPFDDNSFDCVYFTEILEHIAIKNPIEVLLDCNRVLKPGGMFVFSTPNICNISNIYALLNEENIFWHLNLFYGGTDRHNREYTPKEAYEVVVKSGFQDIQMYGINSRCNWNDKCPDFIISELDYDHPFFRNTTVIIANGNEELTVCFGSGWHKKESWGVWASESVSTFEIYAPRQQQLNFHCMVRVFKKPAILKFIIDEIPVKTVNVELQEENESQLTDVNLSIKVTSGITIMKLVGPDKLLSPEEFGNSDDNRKFRLGFSDITVNGLRIL